MNGYQIVEEARTWIDTPFRHQGRLRGVGSDCVGVILGVGKALGLLDFQLSNYGRLPDGMLMHRIMCEHLDKVSIESMQFGDIILFKFDSDPQHVGFYTDVGILHSYADVKKCVETSLDDVWKSRIVDVFRFKGVTGD